MSNLAVELAESFDFECTGADDHDSPVCEKCARLRAALIALLRRAGEGSQAAPPLGKFIHERLGAYLNTMVADLCIEGKGQYLRDLFGQFEVEVAAAAGSGTFAADFINDVKLLNEFTEHETKCGELLLPAPCACGLEEIRQRIYKVMEVWHAQEKRSVGTFAEGIEAAAQEIDQCNREGPYNAIQGASRIRALAQEKREPAP